ncbi:hypothetical protein [Streptomyces sp. NPDC086182]|uniref:hypothetical protein n=1 Tax=Streptomyces sp. NPDC086182 TaxID=3155058 RepID=UPI00342D6776
MTAACLIASPADAATPDSDDPERPSLADVLDVQVAEVPGTDGAFQHFFSDM